LSLFSEETPVKVIQRFDHDLCFVNRLCREHARCRHACDIAARYHVRGAGRAAAQGNRSSQRRRLSYHRTSVVPHQLHKHQWTCSPASVVPEADVDSPPDVRNTSSPVFRPDAEVYPDRTRVKSRAGHHARGTDGASGISRGGMDSRCDIHVPCGDGGHAARRGTSRPSADG